LGGNYMLCTLLNANIKKVPYKTNLMVVMEKLANELTRKGKKPYVIPLGGSNKIGNLGYVTCVQEVLNQTFDMGIKMYHIVTALGSGGTYAGLAIGLNMFNSDATLTGISISGK